MESDTNEGEDASMEHEKGKFIVAVDEGTTSTRACLYDVSKKKFVLSRSASIAQIYPQPSFVEENANEIYANTLSVLIEMIESAPDLSSVAGIGITNQRETVVAWDRKSGKPLYNAIIWQCRRTSEEMEELSATHGEEIRRKTGLVMDAYFSASKIRWLIRNVPAIAEKLSRGEVCFGTVDSFLIYKLTDGKAFVTDATNASRTMLFDLTTLDYDDGLLNLFGIPRDSLPRVVSCDERVGEFHYRGKAIPVCGVAGDQQAALFGQACVRAGMSKITYGTGLFMLCNTGENPFFSRKGLITTVAAKIGKKVTYAFEGSVFNAGSTVQWLRDQLGFFASSQESEGLAESVPDNGGVYLVPAFTGLGAPYWKGDARGMISGLTRASTKAHITRAALEAMAYSAKDLSDAMTEESGVNIDVIRADGGASANDFLMRFQANVLGVAIDRPQEKESTALGAAFLCGIGLGLIDPSALDEYRLRERLFSPDREEKSVKTYRGFYEGWKAAVEQCVYDGKKS